VAVRWRTCPFPAVAARVPERGRILDYGCGHGAFALWLGLLSPAREVLGVDVAQDKIAAAEAAAREAARHGEPGSRVSPTEFRRIRPGEVPAGPWDAILFVDVLYLSDPEDQRELLLRAARELAPAGVLLVKEVADRPRAKAAWNRMQETMAVRVLRITKRSTPGRRFRILPPATHAAWLEAEGLAVERSRLDRGYLHPHHLLCATRAPGSIASV
jgi:2-polyprenyl-3-methyl-5-hydroxy-6-metoxy-1,4-benzoquinol methylase